MPADRAEYRYVWMNETVAVTVESAGSGYALPIDGDTSQVTTANVRSGELILGWEDGRRMVAWVAATGKQRFVALGVGPQAGRAFELSVHQTPSWRTRKRQADGRETLVAQMPGVVRRVLAREGERVARGQTLAILEAMKMEIRVNAPEAGTVTAMPVAEGQAVERGQRLVELEASATTGASPGPQLP